MTAPATKTPMPAWLREHLHATGKLGTDGITRRARTGFCPTCWAAVVRGLDADLAALPAAVDPRPLTALGEVLALAGGRATYELTWTGGRYEIDRRDPWRIKGRPAGNPAIHVVADHACNSPLPAGAYSAKAVVIPSGILTVPNEPQF